MLTDSERALVNKFGECWNDLCDVVGRGPTRAADLGEAIVHIHALQQMVMSNAAGRAFPGEYRLLGESLAAPNEPYVVDVDDEVTEWSPPRRRWWGRFTYSARTS